MTKKDEIIQSAAGELTDGDKEKAESLINITSDKAQKSVADPPKEEAEITKPTSSTEEKPDKVEAEKDGSSVDDSISEAGGGTDAEPSISNKQEEEEIAAVQPVKPASNEASEDSSDSVIMQGDDSQKEDVEQEASVSSVPSEEIDVEPKEVQQESDSEGKPEAYYAELAAKARELSKESDWAYATSEFDNLYFQWGQGPAAEGADLSTYRNEIDTLKEELNEKKRARYEEQQERRVQNLEKKKELLKQFKALLDAEKWSNTRDVDRIRSRWEQIRQLPEGEAEKLETTFQGYLKLFEEHKVDRLVKMKQQEEDNLTLKLVIVERMEALSDGVDKETDWKELDGKLSEYLRQFRKIGRIPAEKNKEVWDRFYAAQDLFSSRRFEFDARYRKEIEANLSRKKKLIDEAEALIDSDDLADAAQRVNKLHRRWKKIGNLPQKDENELWDRFKAATDAFNDKKSENIDELREQEEENYTAKMELITKAVELKDSEEWEQTHKELQNLMDRWKKIGPVPRRKSGKIWKQFKNEMDHFYSRRRDYFKEVKEERKDNLKEKQQVIDQLKELVSHQNAAEAVELAKPLQEEFKKAGYVPIKHKNRLWKEYREVCDEIYERFRATREVVQIVGKEKVQELSAGELTDIKKKQQQADQLNRQSGKMKGELIQMKESLSYFKEGKKGNPLLDQARSRIEKMEQQIVSNEEELRQIEMEIDKLKKGV